MRLRGKILVGILAILIAGLAALQAPVLTRVRGLAWDGWVGSTGYLFSAGETEVSPDVLSQLGELRAENVRLSATLMRFQRLERQLGEITLRNFTAIPALVGSQTSDTFRSQYFLNRGALDGVTLHAPVVTQGSVLVGTVAELSPRSSVVQLLLHPATSIPVEVVLPDEEKGITRGLVQGQSYTGILLTTVPRDKELSTGAAVVTSAHEDGFPYGLTVGTVAKIQSTERDAYQSASLDLPYDPDAL
ncbi:MAG: rod shape-determining protein MreC, partial [Patescibacteria group bacterium]